MLMRFQKKNAIIRGFTFFFTSVHIFVCHNFVRIASSHFPSWGAYQISYRKKKLEKLVGKKVYACDTFDAILLPHLALGQDD